VDLSGGIRITPVYVDTSPRRDMDAHCSSGDQNTHNIVELEATAAANETEAQDIDLSIVGKPLQPPAPQDEPS